VYLMWWYRGNYNINGRDVQGKNVVINVDMSSLRVPWQNAHKNQHTENKHVEHQDPTDI